MTFPGSVVGVEARVIREELAEFARRHPDIPVEHRPTPDDASQRHHLYVQWLNARAPDPDVLQIDVVWTAEFAAAGWLLPLDDVVDGDEDFFPAARQAGRWRGVTYAVPWFVDVGMLYWRTDLLSDPPGTFERLETDVRRVRGRPEAPPFGLVWQGARYEGLVTVFIEYLGAFGGRILDDFGRVVVDSPQAVAALAAMRDHLAEGIVPRAVLNWHEEEARLAFQNGDALFMRNWPYAHSLLARADRSPVAGRFSVAPMPAGPGGQGTSCLGGALLAVSASSDRPKAAKELVRFLTSRERMRRRAQIAGQFPARPSLYRDGSLEGAIAVQPSLAARIIQSAQPRPITPVYAELSEILQIHLHRALSGTEAPAAALRSTAREMRALLRRVGLEKEADPR